MTGLKWFLTGLTPAFIAILKKALFLLIGRVAMAKSMKWVNVGWMSASEIRHELKSSRENQLNEERGLNNIRKFDAGFLFVIKAYKQAHSKQRNCFYNAGDGQKD